MSDDLGMIFGSTAQLFVTLNYRLALPDATDADFKHLAEHNKRVIKMAEQIRKKEARRKK
jgi:hypothetical protein